MLAAAYAVPTVNAAAAVLFSGSLLAALAGPIGYSKTIDISGRQAATVFGAMNMSGNIGTALFPMVATRLVAAADAASIREWIEPSGIRGWDLVLFACAVSYVVSALCWLLINPSGTIFRSTPVPTAATAGPG
jgi:hypothetical protein